MLSIFGPFGLYHATIFWLIFGLFLVHFGPILVALWMGILGGLLGHVGLLLITAGGWQIAGINEICLDNKDMSASLVADFYEAM